MGKIDYQKFYRERLKLKIIKPKPNDPEGEFKSQCPFCGVEGRAVVSEANGLLDCIVCGRSTLENICRQKGVKMPVAEIEKEPAVKGLKGQIVFAEKPKKKKDQKPKAKTRKTKLDKSLTKAFDLEEKRADIHEKINKLVKNWKGLSAKEQKPLFNIIEFDIQLLKPEMRDLIRQRLIKAKIIRAKAFDELVKRGKALELESAVEGEKIDEDKIKHRHLTLIPDLIHLCQDGEAVKYLLKNKGGNLYIKKELIRDTYYDNGEIKNRYIYTPKQDLPIGFTTPEVLDLQGKVDFPDLLAEVMDYIAQRLEMPEEADYLTLALWTFHTYLIERFNTTPIIYACGVKETGKARLGEILRELAFRGQVLTTPTEASIFRESEYLKPCLIIDEIKLAGFDANKEVACLVNNRYKRGVKVCRVSLDKQGEDQLTYYDVFGCTAITTTESIRPALRSRCIVFTMQRNLRAEVERPLDYKRGQVLRNKLTVFRAEFIGKELPAYEQIARGRLNEILLPLYQVLMSVKPAWKPKFREIVKTLRGQRKTEESLSLEYDILQVIVDELGGKIGDLCILTQDIGKAINKEIGEKAKPVSDRSIGFRCKRLGFENWRGQGGKRGFRIKRELLKSLVERYEIELKEKSVNTEA